MPRREVACVVTFTFLLSLLPTAALAAGKDGSLVVFSTTVGAEIIVDGNKVAVVPHEEPLPLPPGAHVVEVKKRGFSQFREEIKVKKGQTVELEVDLIASDGILRLITTNAEGATVQVDKTVVGKTPFDGLVPAGQHILRVSKEGFKDSVRKVEMLAGEPVDLVFELEKLPSQQVAVPNDGTPKHTTSPEFYETWWFWTITGAVVAGGTAAGLAIALTPAEQTRAPFDNAIRF